MEKIDPTVVFSGDYTEQVDFEIAFTAVIATMVLSFSSSGQGYTLLKYLVISLTIITLIRKMAVSNQHKDSTAILQWTIPIIQAITVISTLYLLLVGSSALTEILGLPISPVAVAVLLLPLFIISIFVIHEKLFHDVTLYLALLSHNAAVKAKGMSNFVIDEAFHDRLLDHASGFVSSSGSESIPPELAWLEHRVDSNSSPSFLPLVIYGLIMYGIILTLISWFFGSTLLNLAFLFFVFFVKYPVQFWYSRFGLAKFTSDRSGWVDLFVIFLGLVAANLAILPKFG